MTFLSKARLLCQIADHLLSAFKLYLAPVLSCTCSSNRLFLSSGIRKDVPSVDSGQSDNTPYLEKFSSCDYW